MNILHRWYCKSGAWARSMRRWLPVMLENVEFGDDVLEVGPGPGVTTDWLRERVPRITAVEIDPKLAQALNTRLDGTNVTVVRGDATAMEFLNDSFTSAVSFTMLHHVPTPELQDRLLSEVYRVLRPGGFFVGSDSVPSFMWNLFHVFDTRVPVDPDTFAERLKRAGFIDASVSQFPGGFNFRAKKPAAR